jgi:hypothetical protein
LPSTKNHKKNQLAIELLFSRRLFTSLSDVSINYFPVRTTRGVIQLLRFGNAIDPIVIDALIVMS